MKRVSRFVVALWLALSASVVCAAQYSSEYREVEPEAATSEQEGKSPDAILQSLDKNPYGKALTLQQFAREAVGNKQYGTAINYLEQALSLGALSEYAENDMQAVLARLYVADGRHDKVVEVLGPRIAADPDPSPELQVALANSLVQLKRYQAAAPHLQRAISNSRKVPLEWRKLLLAVHVGLEQWRSAASVLERIIRDEPGNAQHWQQLTAIYLRADNVERALSSMELAHRQGMLDGGDQKLLYARLFMKHGLPFEAAVLLQGWIDGGVLEASADNLQLLATAWIQARERGPAIAAVRAAARRTGSSRMYLHLAQLSIDQRDWRSAASALETALRIGGLGNRIPRAWLSLGMARYQLGDQFGAAEAFRSASAHRSAADLAGQWLTYLESGVARTAAIREATRTAEASLSQDEMGGGRFSFETRSITSDRRAEASVAAAPPQPFTPIGAEWGGNGDGSIPAWAGGLVPSSAPAGYTPEGRLVDPFPDEKPLYVITARNMKQYAGLLTDAHRQLLLKYPEYRLPVYRTHRSVSYPEAVYEATVANEPTARLLGSDALSDARIGFPFRKPDSGVEIMWNHRVRFRGNGTRATTTQMVVDPDGSQVEQFRQTEIVHYRYSNLRDPVDISKRNILLYYLTYFSDDGRTPRFAALVHETANSIKKPRAIWVLPPTIKKLFRVPPVGYDNPFPGAGGISFIDMIDMYNGAFDRYVWRLVGKRDMIVPYNSYRLNDGTMPYAELATGKFMNPQRARYEKHRVWVIEATERGGKRHSFGKRIFYVDEDSWNVVMVENHDREERLWRFQEGHLLPHYHSQFANALPVVTYDLKDGRYFINRLTNEEAVAQFDVGDYREGDFMPASVKNKYSR